MLVEREPAWLTSAADQRLAMFEEALGPVLDHFHVLQMALTEPEDDSDLEYLRWDRSCDNCKDYRPRDLVAQILERPLREDVKAVITVGACPECWELP